MTTPEFPIIVPPEDVGRDYIDEFFAGRVETERTSESVQMVKYLWQLALTTTFRYADMEHQFVLDSINSGKVSYQTERAGPPVTVRLECYSADTEVSLALPSTVTLHVEGRVGEETISFPLYEFTPIDIFRFDQHSYSPSDLVEVNTLEELDYLEGVLLMMGVALEAADHTSA